MAAAGKAARVQQPAQKHRLAGTESAEPADTRVDPRGAARAWTGIQNLTGASTSQCGEVERWRGGWRGVGATCGEVAKRTRGG